MLIFLEIPYENGIILFQKGVQANHMNPLCIRWFRGRVVNALDFKAGGLGYIPGSGGTMD